MLRLLRAEYMRIVINERGRMGWFAEIVPTTAVRTVVTTVVWRRLVRPVLFWTHLIAGVMTGGVVLVMSATGVLLTYQKQITTWADQRGLDGAPPTAAMAPLSLDSLIARARVATGVFVLEVPPDLAVCSEVGVDQERRRADRVAVGASHENAVLGLDAADLGDRHAR